MVIAIGGYLPLAHVNCAVSPKLEYVLDLLDDTRHLRSVKVLNTLMEFPFFHTDV